MHPRRSVGRLRERQYQLAAQKQNEVYQKYSYYQQTARYFERECETARHYDTWNFTDLDFKKQLEKGKKAERLQCRRKKLKKLFEEEENTYKREIEGLKARKSRVQETSLEALKEKLKEKRAEQSLYLPRTCRRYQSYFVYPTLNGFNNYSGSQRSRVCKDSTNLLRQYNQNSISKYSKMSSGPENTEMYVESAGLPTSRDTDDQSQPNPKFLVRYSRQSLENTNVRNEDSEFQEYQPSQRADRSPSMPSSRDSSPTKSRVLHSPEKENQMSKVEHKEYDKDYLSTENQSGHVSSSSQRFQDSCNVATDHVDSCSVTGEHKARHAKKERDVSHNEANLDDQYMSKQMYLYLTHKELKRQIEDLARRELHACTKQCWDEALRLRDMRNRLELSREKELYNMENLDLDEADRKLGLASIDKREEKLSQRENACTDTTMYSEDAKALWKKWMHEDDDSLLQDARAQRELLMTKLEKEWQGLAICDKERVMRTFENVLTGCSLQDEHKLTATMSATRAKSALNRR